MAVSTSTRRGASVRGGDVNGERRVALSGAEWRRSERLPRCPLIPPSDAPAVAHDTPSLWRPSEVRGGETHAPDRSARTARGAEGRSHSVCGRPTGCCSAAAASRSAFPPPPLPLSLTPTHEGAQPRHPNNQRSIPRPPPRHCCCHLSGRSEGGIKGEKRATT